MELKNDVILLQFLKPESQNHLLAKAATAAPDFQVAALARAWVFLVFHNYLRTFTHTKLECSFTCYLFDPQLKKP